ncbi:hypothetical protein QE152_g31959 [Popillia japonica]|uniref:Mutator-like transposase domain-containing protein n=1 Tax=Popillia japonica TaxID=7064 RepID=A0AAW1J0B6_POPJA
MRKEQYRDILERIMIETHSPSVNISDTGISVNEQFQLPSQLSPEEDHEKNDIDLDLPPLEMEADEEYKPLGDLMGRRIVDLAHLLTEYEKVIKYPTKCTRGRMKFTKEFRSGLVTKLYFYCDNCEKQMIICSESESKSVNNAVAWGSLSTGIGYCQCDKLFGVLNIPFMASKTYSKEVAKVKKGLANDTF